MKKSLLTFLLIFLNIYITVAQIPEGVIEAYQTAEELSSQGEYAKAIEYYKMAIDIYEQEIGDKDESYATLINNLALLHQDMGNYEQAENLLIEVLEIVEKTLGKNHSYYATSLNNLGISYEAMGNYAKAEVLFIEALQIRAKTIGQEDPEYANTLNNLGALYRSIGNYELSEGLFIKALEIIEATLGQGSPEFVDYLNNLGMLYQTTNDYEKSEALLLAVLEIRKEVLGTKHPEYATSLNNLALLYDAMENYSEAEKLYLESLTIIENILGKEHPKYAKTLNNLAVLYYKIEKYSQAESLYFEILELRKKILGVEHPDYSRTLNNLASLYYQINDYTQAEIFYLRSLEITKKQIKNLLPYLSEKERKSYLNTTQLYFNNFYIFATKYYEKNPTIAEELLNLQLFKKGLIFQSIQKIQEQILSSNDKALIEEYYTWKAKRGELAKALQMSREERKSADISLEYLKDEENQMQKALFQKSTSDLSGLENLTSLKWQEAQAQLKKGEALVDIIRTFAIDENEKTDTVYIALILKNNSKKPEMFLIKNGSQLENRYKEYYGNKIERREEDKYSYEQFWQPLKPFLKGVEKVYFSADGVYHQINLLTLQNPKTKEYLIDEVEIQLLVSPNDLIATKPKKQTTNFKDYQICLFGFPQYSDHPNQLKEKSKMDRGLEFNTLLSQNEKIKFDKSFRFLNKEGEIVMLEGTLSEVENIEKMASSQDIKTEVFLTLDANEENIKVLKSPTILHIATHGFFLADLPKSTENLSDTQIEEANKLYRNPLLRSGLLLAGAEKTWQGEKAAGEDGILTAEEVLMIDLSGTELVVLSACETGLGKVSNGEGVYGLQRAFQQAGAKSVIMSLWKISDAATQKMMILFYENLLVKKQSTREAFKNAQLELREEFPSPYYWGAFVLIGE